MGAHQNFIAGEWVDGSSVTRDINPSNTNDLVGEYAQPRWVTSRRFAEVRAYVLAAGEIDAEYWIFIDTPTKHDVDEAKATGAPRPKTVITQQYEIEMGLGHHIQAVDVIFVDIVSGHDRTRPADLRALHLPVSWAKYAGRYY